MKFRSLDGFDVARSTIYTDLHWLVEYIKFFVRQSITANGSLTLSGYES